jgi:hypothetical protein
MDALKNRHIDSLPPASLHQLGTYVRKAYSFGPARPKASTLSTPRCGGYEELFSIRDDDLMTAAIVCTNLIS